MANRYAGLMNRILELDHSQEEWEELRKEFDAAVAEATEEELQAFADSGAGEAVCMACPTENDSN